MGKLRASLMDWAEYYLDPDKGYSHSTTLYRAMKGTFYENSNFLSSPPNGVESPRPHINDLERRMADLADKGMGTEIEAVRCYYKAWVEDKAKPVRSAAWKICVARMGTTKTTFYRWKESGERAILNTYRVY